MKYLSVNLLILLLLSCSGDKIFTAQSEQISPNILETVSTPTENISTSEIKIIGEYALIRNSDAKDENGWMLPPYKYAEVKIGLYHQPQIGEEITIVPLNVKIEPFQLKITNATKTKNQGCVQNEKKEFFWAVETEKITSREVLEVNPVNKGYKNEMPFSVFAIYPAIKFAKSLNKLTLSKKSLPKSVLIENVESAIDLDNDGKPDLLSVSFCCGEPNKVKVEKCPFVCKKYYKKNSKTWELFEIQDFQEIC
jgi:hypothetical protein